MSTPASTPAPLTVGAAPPAGEPAPSATTPQPAGKSGAAKPKPVPTVEEKKVLEAFAAKFTGQPPPKPEKAPPEKEKEKPAVAEEEPKAAVPAAAPKKPAPKKKPAPAAAPEPPPYETLVKAAAEGAAKAFTTAKPAPETPEEDADLPDGERRKLTVLKHMENLFPDKYPGIAQQHRKALDKGVAYAKKWEKENPDEEFDPTDEAHAEFFKEAGVDWDDTDYMEALVDMKAEEKTRAAVAQVEQSNAQRYEELKRGERARELAPEVVRHGHLAAKEFFSALEDEELAPLRGLIKEDGSMDGAVQESALKANAMAWDVVAAHYAGNVLEPMARELYAVYNGLQPYDPNNQLHNYLNTFMERQERAMNRADAERIDEEGRSFLPMVDFARLDPSQRSRHWTFDARELSARLAREVAKDAGKAYQTEKARFERWSGKVSSIKAGSRAEAAEEGEGDEEGKPDSPTIATDPKTARSGPKGPSESNSPLAVFQRKFLGVG